MSTMTGNQTGPVVSTQKHNAPAPYWRLIWKDARELLPLLIAIFFSVVVCLSLTLWSTNSGYSRVTPMYVSAHTFIAFTAIVAGVFLFANENERRTVQMLRNMPILPAKIVIQKIVVGLVCTLVMSVVTAGLTSLFARFSPAPGPFRDDVLFGVGNMLVLPMYYLVVGALAAMITRSLYYGLLVAGLIAVVTISMVEPTWIGAASSADPVSSYRWWALLGLTALTVVVLTGRANGWVEEQAVLPAKTIDWAKTDSSSFSDRFGLRPLNVLVWHSFRQSKTPLICCAGLVAWSWLMLYGWGEQEWSYLPRTSDKSLLLSCHTLLAMAAIVMMFSGSVFLADQRNQNYRFFQQNVERPWQFWLARLLPWWCLAALLVIAWNVFLFDSTATIDDLVDEFYLARSYHSNLGAAPLADLWLQIVAQSAVVPMVGLLGLIGIGQLFSMFLRSAILATIFSMAFNIAFMLSVFYVIFAGESVWLFVVVPVVAVYLATFIRCKDWLGNRTGWVRFCLPLAIPICVCAVLGVGFIYHRAYEFDDVTVDFDRLPHSSTALMGYPNFSGLLGYGTKTEREQTANLYRDAIELCDESAVLRGAASVRDLPAEVRRKYLEQNAKSIDNIILASQNGSCGLFLDSDPKVAIGERATLLRLMLIDSYDKTCNGQYKSALASIWAYDRAGQRTNYVPGVEGHDVHGLLIHWADQPGQDPELIKLAINRLSGQAGPSQGASATLKASGSLFGQEIFRIRGIEEAALAYRSNIQQLQEEGTGVIGETPALRTFWWEAERQSKLLQRLYTNVFVKQVAAYLRYSNTQAPMDSQQIVFELQGAGKYSIHPADMRLCPTLYNLTDDYMVMYPWMRELSLRRYTLLRMGLAAYRHEHGQYPDQLDQLSIYFPGGIPDTADPKKTVQWYPQGLPNSIVERLTPSLEPPQDDSDIAKQFATEVIAPRTPMLAFVSRAYGRTPATEAFWIRDSSEDTGRQVDAIEVTGFGPSQYGYWKHSELESDPGLSIGLDLPAVKTKK